VARRWFKLWIEEWETGSIRVDMDSAERGFWADMIGCAMKSRVEGLLCRDSRGQIGYTNIELANKYGVPVELVESTIAKRLKDGSIFIRPNNVIEIVNIFKYQSKTTKKNGKHPDGDEMPETVDEKITKQRMATRQLAYKFPEDAKQGLARRDSITEKK